MSLERARECVREGAAYLDAVREAPSEWHMLIDPESILRIDDVIGTLAPHMSDDSVSDVSTALDMIGLVLSVDREDNGFDYSVDSDPSYATTEEEVVQAWREEIKRRRAA